MTRWIIFVSLISSGILLGLSLIVFNNERKASVFSTFFLMALFTYGYFTDIAESLFYRGLWPFSSVHRYLLFAYLLFFALLFLFIKKTKRTFSDFNLYLNAFCMTLMAITIINFLFKSLSSKTNVMADCQNNSVITNTVKLDPSSQKPDIYYIILDGYGRQDILKKHYNFDNSYFTDFLKSKGFYVCDSSFSNYPATRLSLSSSLNMNYIDSLQSDCGNVNDPQNFFIKQNIVTAMLKDIGYNTIHVKSGYSVTAKNDIADVVITPSGLNEFERSFLHLTILRLDEVFGFFLHQRISSQLDVIKDLPASRSPKFVFIHIVCPHPPYIFKRNGSFKLRSRITNKQWWEPREDYREQAEFISDKMMEYIDLLLDNSINKPVIILQSDHGPYIQSKNITEIYDSRRANLNAFLVPDTVRSMLYPSISPVNSFRMLFNGLFGTHYNKLPDLPPPIEIFKQDAVTKGYLRSRDGSGPIKELEN